MGGWGSGAYGPMGPLTRKATVEESYCISIQSLKDCLDNKRATYSWDNGKMSMTVVTKINYIILAYKYGETPMTTRVNITSTNVGYGKRKWFVCPSCVRNTAKLYLKRGLFRCRDCHDLTYLTCQESGDPLDYLALNIRRLQRNLGLEGAKIDDVPYIKPKYMHQRTYEKLRFKLVWLQEKRNREFIRQAGVRYGI